MKEVYMKKINKILLTTIIACSLALNLTSCIAKTTSTNVSSGSGVGNENTGNVVKSSQIVKNLQDLDNNLKIGCQDGSISETWISKNVKNSNVMTYADNNKLVQNLVDGNLDAIFVDEYFGNYIAKNNDLSISDLKFSVDEYAFAFKKGNNDLRNFVNSALTSLINDGTINELKDAYMPEFGEVALPQKMSYNDEYSTTIIVGTCADFYPIEYYSNGSLYGFDITLIEKIAEINSWNVEFVNMDFNKLITSLELGQIDMIASGISKTLERSEKVDFSIPYFETEQVVVTK